MFSFFKKKSISFDKRSLVSVRMEAVGGQGANSSGKILAEAAVVGMGFSGNHFSSFGSEKRGSPVSSYVRFSVDRRPVRSATQIKNPDILVIFHESLISNNPSILEGSTDITDVLVNSALKPQNLKFPKGMNARSITTVDAVSISRKYNAGLNAVMLGALQNLVPEIDNSCLRKYFSLFFSKLSKEKMNGNLKAYEAGFKQARVSSFSANQAQNIDGVIKLPEMGWVNAPIGGVITNPGNSVIKNHSASRRGVVPQFNRDICFDCGFCDMVCPDFCFVWDKNDLQNPKLKGIDYQYCKGCQKCITVCPVNALNPVRETEISDEEKKQKVFPEVKLDSLSEQQIQKSWLYYVDHLSEKDYMLSPQTELLNPNSYIKSVVNLKDIEPYLTDEMKEKVKK